ncbi:Cleavage and polyadenylation specificity factor subunit 3-I [Glycine soja]|nr:Cleavage and polyadenylation specificity factor subunit 3-I [Glycine soja]
MASSSLIRLRRTIRTLSGISHSLSATHAASFSSPIRCGVSWSLQSPKKGVVQSRSFRSSSISLLSFRSSQRQNNIPDEIGPDTILFEGCDYNHWLIVMEFKDNNKPSPEDMVRVYEETCAKGLNISLEEAKKKMYACSTTTYIGFQAVMTEEESKKFEGLPGVVFVLPDSYIDPVNKQYGGDQYINGTIIPRPPPVQYGRNQGRRDWNKSPGQYNRHENPMPRPQGNPSFNSQGPMPGGGRNYGPSQNYPPQQNYGQASQNYPPQQNYAQASQNYPPQQNYGQASQNYPPQQNYGMTSQNYTPQQNYGQASPNYPPQQKYGQAPQNYPPQQNFDQAPQNYPQQQRYGPSSPQYAQQQSFGPPGQGERRNYMPQQNFGRPGQGERRDPVPRHGASEVRGDTFTPSYAQDFKPAYMEGFEQAELGNHPAKEQAGSQQRYPPSGPGFTGEVMMDCGVKRRESVREEDDEVMIVTPLGAGNEVGRSCVYMSYKGKSILFDCGIHLGFSGMSALPYFDEIDPSTLDVLLITHFHLDHAASLPYFLEKTTFRGRVFMTYATKAIYKLLLSDFVKVSKVSVEDMLFDEQDINRSMDKIEVIDFHQTVEVNGIRFWCYAAGHVLGAAMFMVDIAGVRVLYTGDYSREEDRHLRAAEIPQFSPDVCIIESTYGVQHHQPRHTREKRFTDVIHSTISQGGRVLIPAYALGRAQELLLILDEYWANHPELHNIPIYYASPLAKKCLTVYETYTLSMNDRVQNAKSNPFSFKHISALSSIEVFKDVGPSVVMASPGGLQSGLSRQLFDKWCSDKKNTCVLPGFVVEGTLAKTIMTEPKEVTLMNGLSAPLNMQVHYISFSAHADSAQTSAFLEELNPPNIILVHGEANQMGRLKQKLTSQFADRNTKILTPKNCQSVEMHFNSQKMAKTIGRLAEKTPEVGETVSGLLVKKGFTYQIMAPDDLHVFSQLSTTNITQRITVPYSGAFSFIQHRLKRIYESVEQSVDEESGVPELQVHECVTVKHEAEKHISLHWTSDPISDMVSDSIVALILNINRDVPKIMAESDVIKIEEENKKKAEKVMHALLVSLFGDVKAGENGKLIINIDGNVAVLNKESGEVESENEGLKERVRAAFQRIQSSVKPIPLSAP